MSTTASQPFRLNALEIGIIALVSDSHAPEQCGSPMALSAAEHDHHVVSVQPVAAPLWTPLISRDEALAALPGRDASAEEVLAAVATLARRIAPPGHLVDVGARGVFVDATAKTRIPRPWSSRRRTCRAGHDPCRRAPLGCVKRPTLMASHKYLW